MGAVEWSHRYYYDYASETLSGKIPYRDFPFEYPLLSYPLFLIPRLLVSDFESYRFAFMGEMFLFDVAAIVLIARHGGLSAGTRTVARRLGWYTLYCFLLAPLVIGRFELAPMALAFAATCWWFSGRAIRGGVTAGLGALMKIFPGVVAAPALVWEAARLRTTRARGTAAFLVTLVVGLAFWFGLGGRRVLEPLGYHAGRGLEIESLFGGAAVPRRDDLGVESSMGFRPQRVSLGFRMGSQAGVAGVSSPGDGASSWSCGPTGNRGWPTASGSRQPRCSHSSSLVKCCRPST